MSVEVDLSGDPDALRSVTFADSELQIGRYCFSVGAGGTLIVLVDERGESRIDRVYSPAAWHSVRGDVWRKGMLLG